jgi:hypothetical protein
MKRERIEVMEKEKYARVPQPRDKSTRNRQPPPSVQTQIPNEKGYRNEKDFYHNICNPHIVHKLHIMVAFLPWPKLPWIGKAAGEGGSKDTGDGPDGCQADEH